MEEAWELATVSEEVSNKSLNEWSARHVRLKFQMVLTALTLYVSTNFALKEINLLGSMKFNLETEKSEVVLFLSVVCMFFLISFITRSFIEFSHWSSNQKDLRFELKILRLLWKQGKDISDEMEKHQLFSDIESFLTNDFPEDNQEKKRIQRVLAKEICEIADEFDVWFARCSKAVDSANSKLPNIISLSEGIRSGVHPRVQVLDKAIADAHRITSNVTNVSSMLHANGLSMGLLQGMHINSLKNIYNSKSQFKDIYNLFGRRILELKMQEDVRGFILNGQNVVLSVIFPVLAAILLFYFSFDVVFKTITELF